MSGVELKKMPNGTAILLPLGVAVKVVREDCHGSSQTIYFEGVYIVGSERVRVRIKHDTSFPVQGQLEAEFWNGTCWTNVVHRDGRGITGKPGEEKTVWTGGLGRSVRTGDYSEDVAFALNEAATIIGID